MTIHVALRPEGCAAVSSKRTRDKTLNFSVASGKLNVAISGVLKFHHHQSVPVLLHRLPSLSFCAPERWDNDDVGDKFGSLLSKPGSMVIQTAWRSRLRESFTSMTFDSVEPPQVD